MRHVLALLMALLPGIALGASLSPSSIYPDPNSLVASDPATAAAVAAEIARAQAQEGKAFPLGQDYPTFYVSPTGSDSASCLASGTACLTLQGAFNKAISASHFGAVINVAHGSYTGGVLCVAPAPGNPNAGIQIVGDTASPSSVLITSGGNTFQLQNSCIMSISGVKMVETGQYGAAFSLDSFAHLYFDHVDFGTSPAGGGHIAVNNGSQATATGPYTISGGGGSHYHTFLGGNIKVQGQVVTVLNNPNFSDFFAGAAMASINVQGTTYTGAATGLRWLIHNGAFVDMGQIGCPATFFPGSTAGITDNLTFGTCDYVAAPQLATTASPSLTGTVTLMGAANGFTAVGAPATGTPTIQAVGSDTNVGLTLQTKGAGILHANGALAVSGFQSVNGAPSISPWQALLSGSGAGASFRATSDGGTGAELDATNNAQSGYVPMSIAAATLKINAASVSTTSAVAVNGALPISPFQVLTGGAQSLRATSDGGTGSRFDSTNAAQSAYAPMTISGSNLSLVATSGSSVQANGAPIGRMVAAPATSTSPCIVGDMAVNAGQTALGVCVATNTWKSAALAAFVP